MGLINCKVCKGQVSSDAKACPHCGAPKSKFAPSGPGCLILFLVLVGVGWISNCVDSGSKTDSSNVKATKAAPAKNKAQFITISTDNLRAAYAANEKEARAKYGFYKKPIRIGVYGKVEEIKWVYLTDGYEVFIKFPGRISLSVFSTEINYQDQNFIQNELKVGDSIKVDSVFCSGTMDDGTIDLNLSDRAGQTHSKSLFHPITN